MQRCRRAFSASHFAMATSVVSLASTFSGYASGPLNERLGHPLFFTVAFLASIPSLVLVLLVPKTSIELDPDRTTALIAGRRVAAAIAHQTTPRRRAGCLR